MFARAFLSVLLLLVLSACASNPYKIDKDQVENVSSIKGYSERDGLFTWLSARIESIDGKSVSYILKSETDYEIPVTPEMHKFLVLTEFNKSFGGACPCVTFTELVAPIAPNSSYGLKARVDGAGVEVWIENLADSTAITEVVKTRYAPSQRNNYVPIIIY